MFELLSLVIVRLRNTRNDVGEELSRKKDIKAYFAKPPKKRKRGTRYSINISGSNNTTIVGDNNLADNSKIKDEEKEKEKTADNSTNVEISDRFAKHWLKFIENDENFHPYSPEAHGIIRCDKGVDTVANIDKKLYNEHVSNHGYEEFPLPKTCIEYVNTVIDSRTSKEYKAASRRFPEVESEEEELALEFLEEILRGCHKFYMSKLDIKDGESVFDWLFIYPFLKAVADSIAAGIGESLADFRPGEAALKSMLQQLQKSNIYQDESANYLADGIIKLYGIKEIEVLMLETSWHFGCTDKSKHSFDHHKGLFGSLAILKNIADEFSFGELGTFSNIKIFFLHAAGDNMYLWSICFKTNGNVYELWLERRLNIKPGIEDKLENVPNFVTFFWDLKCLISKSVKKIMELKKEHQDALTASRFGSNNKQSLSETVDPSILKLVEEDDKTGMASLGGFYPSATRY